MSEYNIQMNKYNALNAEYDQLYPQPMKHASTHAKDGSDPILPSSIGAAELDESGKVPSSQLPEMGYSKPETLSDTTKALFGLSSDAVPDDAFKEISRHISAILCPQIIVTAPTGSTVTCTKGTTVLTAQEVEGTWTFDVQEYGEWTLTVTNGLETNRRTVLIDIVGIYKIKIPMSAYLYKDGEGADNFTPATSYSDWGLASDTSSGVAQKDSTSLYFGDNSTTQYQVGGFKTTVDFTDYAELHVRVALHGTGGNGATDSRQFCIYLNGEVVFRSNNVESEDYEEYVVDVSSYGSNTVLGLMCHCGASKAWYQTGRVSKVCMN